MKRKKIIKYTSANRTLHIWIGKYHVLISRSAGIIRKDGNSRVRWLWGWR